MSLVHPRPHLPAALSFSPTTLRLLSFDALLALARRVAGRSLPASTPTRCLCHEGQLCGEGARLLLGIAHATAERDWPRWHRLHAEFHAHRAALLAQEGPR